MTQQSAITDREPDHGPGELYAVVRGGDDATALRCGEILRAQGIGAALGFLNGRTRYRFTGLYRTEPPLLHNLALFDRENPTISVSCSLKPLDETYCAVVWSSGRPYSVVDGRLCPPPSPAPAPASDPVLSYSGVAIRAASGIVVGTLCHFDVRPRLLHPLEVEVLQAVAPLFLGEVTGVAAVPLPSPASARDRIEVGANDEGEDLAR